MIQQIPTANAYGGVLLTACGQVLLREPANHFDGYHWTFAKGKADPEENPEHTALREVYEETGYVCQIVGVLPGVYKSSLSGTAMFVMYPLNEQHPYSWETESTRWVSVAEAKTLIGTSTNKAGRERDLQILADAQAWFENHPDADLPAAFEYCWQPAQQHDWDNQPLPEKITTVPLGLVFTAQQSALLRMGFVPTVQEEKWFSYFADNVLYLHRSWTGICIFKIYFEPHEDGLLATHAEVNREPEQYGETEDEHDILLIRGQMIELADISSRLKTFEHQQGSLAALLSLTKPNYLGSPDTVQELFHSYFTTLADIWRQSGTSNDAYQQMDRLSLIFSGQNPAYTTMPWHSAEQLGQALVKGCGLDADYYEGENLYCIVSESLVAIKLQFDLFRKPYLSLLDDQSALAELVQTLHQLQDYVRQLFLGTHTLSFPDKTLTDFVPPPMQETGSQVKDGFDAEQICLPDEDGSEEMDVLYENLFEEWGDEDEDEEYDPNPGFPSDLSLTVTIESALNEFFDGLRWALDDCVAENLELSQAVQQRATWLHEVFSGDCDYLYPHLWHSSGLIGDLLFKLYNIGTSPETAVYEAGLLMGNPYADCYVACKTGAIKQEQLHHEQRRMVVKYSKIFSVPEQHRLLN